MEQQKHNPKVEWGFYATTPRIVRTQYKNITLVEKWLYVCLKDLCGDTGTCYRTLRVLASETDLALGTLSTGIRHLHDAGLIHAEKKRRSNNPTAKEVWHITIVDIWQENAKVHPTAQRSPDEQKRSGDEHYTENVQEMNNNVHVANNDASERSGDEQQCSNFDDRSNNIEVITITEERTMEEESTGEQSNTTTSASSLPLDATPSSSPQSEIDTHLLLEGDRHALVATGTLPDANPARSALDRGWQAVGEVSDGKEQEIARTCDTCGRPQTQADCLWCMTTRLPAIPKPAPLPGEALHDENRDASPRNVAVGQDLGAASSVPIPPVPPEVSPPRTMRATVVSPDGPQLSVVPQKGRRGKKVEQDKPAAIPKCDTREIQRRINAHRGYALEEDVDIIRERKAIKTWCNLHTLEDYSVVMEGLKRDKYWGKDENHYRIGGVTLLKETSRILAGREQTAGTPTNGQGRTQQWRSSFDDPDYDMSSEFYPSEAERSRPRAAAK